MGNSRSGSSFTATPMISDSSDDDVNEQDTHANGFDSASRLGSPSISSVHESRAEVDDDSVTCLWDDCGLVFTDLQVFIDHIHNECDKSFTRSDALAKHMRLQHSIEPPAPGRGGTRKRKRDETSPPPTNGAALASGSGFRTFKVEQPWSNSETMDEADLDYENYTRAEAAHRRPPVDEEEESALDVLPAHLKSQFDSSSRRVMGRSPEMVMYILTKAKHKYALQRQEALLAELTLASAELNRVRGEKDAMMDRVLHATFGSQAEVFTKPIQKPAAMILDQKAILTYANGAESGH
ncbi:hypothetical protein HHX47_DHR3000282 [Lentinula edodes]|nr:hypothetical protein HHX47_DHR3000282 [Lentinula edodes]